MKPIVIAQAMWIPFLWTLPTMANEPAWHDRFYQYRMPLVVEARSAGWHRLPVTAAQITTAINRPEEMPYRPDDQLFPDPGRLPSGADRA